MNPSPRRPREVAERAASVLGPESGLFEDLDAAGFGDAMAKAIRADPDQPAGAACRRRVQLASDLARIPLVAAARWFGRETEPPVPVDPKDRRFADPAWTDNPRLLLGAAGLPGRLPLRPGRGRRRPTLDADAAAQGGDGRRAAARRAGADELPADQSGRAQAGVRHRRARAWSRARSNFVDDLRQQRGPAAPGRHQRRSRSAGTSPATPGKVVYRNELMELHPVRAADRAGARDARCCAARRGSTSTTSWISRPGRSFIEWAVQHGRTVFAISYRNPTAEMSGTTMDDYLVHGPADGAGRDPGDHRRRHHRHRRAVPRRRAHRDHRGLPDAGRRQPDRHADAAQHHARLLRAGRAGHVHRPAHGGQAREEDGARRARSRARRWPAPSTCCGPTT